jgi:acetyltransferase-like isoleucine patch superfamily enzyme
VNAWDQAAARWRLRECTKLGERPALRGAPFVRNLGTLEIGDDFALSSTPVASHLFVTGALRIGHRVQIGSGAAISCVSDLQIEDDVRIGAFSLILDTNYHLAEDFSVGAKPKPVCIGKGAHLGHHVVVLPGSAIGTGAVVKSGAVVSGEIAKNSVVEGNPARVRLAGVGLSTGAPEYDVPKLVMRVLGLSRVPDFHAGPSQIPEWDSLGALRLIVALEETFGVSLSEEQAKAVQSIRQLLDHVEAASLGHVNP